MLFRSATLSMKVVNFYDADGNVWKPDPADPTKTDVTENVSVGTTPMYVDEALLYNGSDTSTTGYFKGPYAQKDLDLGIRFFDVEVTVRYEYPEASDAYRIGTYLIHVERSDEPLQFVELADLKGFQPENTEQPLYRIKWIGDTPVRKTDDSGNDLIGFAAQQANYELVLDYTDNKLWLYAETKQDTDTLRLTRSDDPSYEEPMVSGQKFPLDLGTAYFEDEDYQVILTVTVTDKDGKSSKYNILVRRGDRKSGPARLGDLKLYHSGITPVDLIDNNLATLWQADLATVGDIRTMVQTTT